MIPSKKKPEAPKRLPYEKPVLRSISLVADQVLGVGCKIDASSRGSDLVTGCVAVCSTTYAS